MRNLERRPKMEVMSQQSAERVTMTWKGQKRSDGVQNIFEVFLTRLAILQVSVLNVGLTLQYMIDGGDTWYE